MAAGAAESGGGYSGGGGGGQRQLRGSRRGGGKGEDVGCVYAVWIQRRGRRRPPAAAAAAAAGRHGCTADAFHIHPAIGSSVAPVVSMAKSRLAP